MTIVTTETSVNGPKKRGRPARISRRQVVGAAVDLARDVGLENVQMATVAERLGVRPSALNYHVVDRQELLEAAANELADLRFPDGWKPSPRADWRTWIRAYATAFRAMLLAQPQLAPYIKLGPDKAASLEDVDEFLGVLDRAGFDPAFIATGTTFIGQTVVMNVQDELMARAAGGHPQMAELTHLFDGVPADVLPNIRKYVASGVYTNSDGLFEFAVDCIVAGFEAQLPRKQRRR